MGAGDRLCFRLKSRFPVFYKGPEDPRQTKAFSTDISTSGMGILTSKTPEKNSLLDLRIGVPGSLRKISLRGRVVHQMWSKGKNRKFLFNGIRFEEVSEKDLDTITRFISKQIHMSGIRTFVLLAGLAAFAAFFFRFLFYSMLGIFQGTTFGKEWLTGILGSLPADWIAYLYAAMAILVLVPCFCFFFMKRHASLGVLIVASVGFLDQGIRCVLKIPYFLEGFPGTWIFLAETGLLAFWGMLLWAMLQQGGNYEQILDSIQEDAGFKPAAPPPKEIPPKVNHVFLP